jgi:hypothetical protein
LKMFLQGQFFFRHRRSVKSASSYANYNETKIPSLCCLYSAKFSGWAASAGAFLA